MIGVGDLEPDADRIVSSPRAENESRMLNRLNANVTELVTAIMGLQNAVIAIAEEIDRLNASR